MIKEMFSDEQVAVFQKFIRSGFDIDEVKSTRLNANQLKELYLGRKAGVDTSLYCSPMISAEEMKELRRTFSIVFDNYDQDQIIQILDAAKHGVNFRIMLKLELDHLQMRQIKLGERYGIDTSVYNSPNFSAEQMQQLRFELIVRKVIETIKENHFERWEKIIESAKHEKPPTEDSADLNDIVSMSRTDGVIETYMFNSELAVIANKVYERVCKMLLENERVLVDERVLQIKIIADRVSDKLMRRIKV